MDKFGNSNFSPNLPAIVISCGSWHVPAHYEPMVKPLREKGFQVIVPQLQSVGGSSDPGDALRNDAAALARIIEHLARLRRDVILFMHAYGGIVGCEALGILDESRVPGISRVKRLIFFSAHIIEKGLSFFDMRGGRIPDLDVDDNGMTMHEKPYDKLYSDVSREDAEPALKMLQRMALSAYETKARFSGWHDYGIPVTFIRAQQDVSVTLEACNRNIEKLEDAGIHVDVETIDAGHCAFYTAPGKLVDLVEKVVASTKSE